MDYRNVVVVNAGDYLDFLLSFDLEEKDRQLLDLFCDLYGYEKQEGSLNDYKKYLKKNVTLVPLNIDSTSFIKQTLLRVVELGIDRLLNTFNSPNGYFGNIGVTIGIEDKSDLSISLDRFLEVIQSLYDDVRDYYKDSIIISEYWTKLAYMLSKYIVYENGYNSALAITFGYSIVQKLKYDEFNLKSKIKLSEEDWKYVSKLFYKYYPCEKDSSITFNILRLLSYYEITLEELNSLDYKKINYSLSFLIGKEYQTLTGNEIDFNLSYKLSYLLEMNRNVSRDVNQLLGVQIFK